MNKTFKTIFDKKTSRLVVASELAKNSGNCQSESDGRNVTTFSKRNKTSSAMLKIAGLLGLCIATMPMAYAIGNGNIGGDSTGGPGGSATPVPLPPVGSGQTAGGNGFFPPSGGPNQNIPKPSIQGRNLNTDNSPTGVINNNLDAKIKANTEGIKANKQMINNNNRIIGNIDAKVSGLVSKVAKDSNRIDHVIADNTSNASHIKDNATKIATNKEGITKNKELIGKTDARVSGVVTKVADNTNKIDHVIADTTINAQNIAKIAKERADVSGVISKVAINTASINNVSARISSNTKAIEANKTAIAENQSRINHLDKREERHMAQLSALAGLFQPYEIGQFYVTGAVGQYRNNTGIALGSGYRLNRNVAFKVGVSMTTQKQDDAAYNAGVYIGF
ncbi:YadA-like family protein [Actinobacillus delphinicola]|uniref:Adhesin yadA n=1 Tax=Actinobacillus delphinicola TaxID=51161 RepID=A0A448TV05_9PAST|nr:YadA-like family protein [Actinobacillus delphinicola]VEJ09763.1 Adhesin yadA precursor [Actinobacillus delphinicola]